MTDTSYRIVRQAAVVVSNDGGGNDCSDMGQEKPNQEDYQIKRVGLVTNSSLRCLS